MDESTTRLAHFLLAPKPQYSCLVTFVFITQLYIITTVLYLQKRLSMGAKTKVHMSPIILTDETTKYQQIVLEN